MGSYVVRGTDGESGEPVEMSVSFGSVTEAAAFAAKRGVVLSSIESDSGHSYHATESGGLRRSDERPERSGEGTSDTPLMVFAFLIPPVGLIAGSIRLARKDPSGTKVLVAAVLGAAVGVILSLAAF
jgi:hypothetical protein